MYNSFVTLRKLNPRHQNESFFCIYNRSSELVGKSHVLFRLFVRILHEPTSQYDGEYKQGDPILDPHRIYVPKEVGTPLL